MRCVPSLVHEHPAQRIGPYLLVAVHAGNPEKEPSHGARRAGLSRQYVGRERIEVGELLVGKLKAMEGGRIALGASGSLQVLQEFRQALVNIRLVHPLAGWRRHNVRVWATRIRNVNVPVHGRVYLLIAHTFAKLQTHILIFLQRDGCQPVHR